MEAPSTAARRHYCFIDGDEGLAPIVEMESPAFSGSQISYYQHQPSVSRAVVGSRRGSIRNIATAGYGCSSPRFGRVHDYRFEEVNHLPHFLEACFLCQNHISNNRDIFMYRGDTPFCSEECRQEQIERDEANEKKWNLSAGIKAMRSKKMDSSTQKSSDSSSYRAAAGTVAAA